MVREEHRSLFLRSAWQRTACDAPRRKPGNQRFLASFRLFDAERRRNPVPTRSVGTRTGVMEGQTRFGPLSLALSAWEREPILS